MKASIKIPILLCLLNVTSLLAQPTPTPTPGPKSIAGIVLHDNRPLAGVTLSGGTLGTVVTDASGSFRFPDQVAGTRYEIVPSLSGYTFIPKRISGKLNANRFVRVKAKTIPPATLTLTGVVRTTSGTALSGVSILASGCNAAPQTQLTTDEGIYTVSYDNLCTKLELALSKPGYTFRTGPSTSLLVNNPRRDYWAIADDGVVTGDLGISGVSLSLAARSGNCTVSAQDFRCSGLPRTEKIIIEPQVSGYVFAPPRLSITRLPKDRFFRFTAIPSLGGGTGLGCRVKHIHTSRSRLTPGLLRSSSLNAMDELRLLAQEVSRSRARRVAQLAEALSATLAALVARADISLDRLPALVYVCPTATGCISVDNSSAINRHVEAVLAIQSAASTAIQKASRYAHTSRTRAARSAGRYLARIRAVALKSLNEARAVPTVQKVCA